MHLYEMFELQFTGQEPEDSWADIDLTAVFENQGEKKTVKGFYAGNGIYKVRFLPEKTGTYTWQVSGIVAGSGTEVCESATGQHHGMVQAEGTHFAYQDGTKYLPFGTTIYALAHQEEAVIQDTFVSLKNSPFNKVRHCIFPKHYLYNQNDPEYFPFEKNAEGNWDVHRPCMKFWEHFETIVEKLGGMEIETDLILFHSYDRWGFSLLSMEESKIYLEYAIRRLAAYPYVWWSLANEYDFLFNRKIEDWYEIEEFVAQADPYGHLLSNHNGVHHYDFSRPNITHCCVQTDAMHKADVWQERYQKPVVYDECCYEGNIEMSWGNISAFEMVNRFWRGCTKGAYVTHGETFVSEDEILWWAKGGVLKGESAPRIAFLKDILYALPSCLTPWTEPMDVNFADINMSLKDCEDPDLAFRGLLQSCTAEEQEIQAAKDANYAGHCGEEAFLKYYARQCVAVSSIMLPSTHTYKIEAIDVWKMERWTIAEKASGKTMLKLPGKEGIAVLATIC